MAITTHSAQLKPGYKQTEVGAVPEDWDVKKLGEVCFYKNGTALEAYFNSYHGFNVISIGNYSPDGTYIDTFDYINEKYYAKIKKYTLRQGDLCMILNDKTSTGTIIGRVLLIKENDKFVFNQRSMRLTPYENIFSDYLYYVINSDLVHNKIKSLAKPGTQIYVNTGDVTGLDIPIPKSLKEQHAIAATLNDVDDLIASLDRLIVKKRDVKQATMQQFLTSKSRLPGFGGEWKVKKLGYIAEVLKGSGLSKNKITESGKMQCILYGQLFTTYGRVISNVISSTNTIEGIPSSYGDILIPGSTTTVGIDLATASALLQANVLLGGDINIIRARGDWYHPVFLAYYLTESKKQAIAERAQGITIIHLYGRDLLDLEVSLPSLEEQQALAYILSDMDAEIAALEQKRDKTRALKQGMMQELLTGRIRLL